jgi:prolipoprotein diacylglyceryltransferase
MRQVLFTLPIFKESFPPDGIPMYGFGAMLFVAFVVVTLWGSQRARRTAGLPPERFQDMVIWLFVAGIVGARVLYMIQYANHFPDKSILGLVGAFFKIWEGGIIFYGSALGGAIGYGLFYWYVLRRLHINGWKLADAAAPLLALGLAVGRIGCYLNGCCWGQVACEECKYVPLGAAHFPLLPAHARQQLVREQYLQTTTGFTVQPHAPLADPRTRVQAVEPGSPADRAGLKPGDLVVGVNGRPNSIILDLTGPPDKVDAAAALMNGEKNAKTDREVPGGRKWVVFDKYEDYLQARMTLRGVPGVEATATDRLADSIRDWPRGKNEITLTVERGPEGGATEQKVTFEPVTVGLYPTQLYETVSMALLILFLLAYYPFRRHDGQLMTLLMMGYAFHRFVNESLRIEPTVGGGLTLSQWGSVVIFVAAVAMEIYLWRTMPSRWSGAAATEPPQPSSGGAAPTPA